MDTALFRGELVRLAAGETEMIADALARWSHDADYLRLLDSNPARPASASQLKEEIEKESQKPDQSIFVIRSLADDRLIGFTGLDGIGWTHGDAWLGIGIGSREDWGKGYGTDAVRVLLRYAFSELNLHRVTLTAFEYNPRALRAYQKAGFMVEGRMRQYLCRDGRRWDLIFMGILRPEWEKVVRGP